MEDEYQEQEELEQELVDVGDEEDAGGSPPESGDESGQQEQEQDSEIDYAAEIERLSKAERGMRDAMIAERKRYQEQRDRTQLLEGRLHQLTDLLTKHQGGSEQAEGQQHGQQQQQAGGRKIKVPINTEVYFDENGDPRTRGEIEFELPENKFDPAQFIQPLQQQFMQMQLAQRQRDHFNRLAQVDVSFPEQSQTLNSAWEFVDGAAQDIVASNDDIARELQGMMRTNPHGAMERLAEYVEGSDYGEQLQQHFPGLDVLSIMESKTSPMRRQRALMLLGAGAASQADQQTQQQQQANPQPSRGKQRLNNMQKIAGKPGNLLGVRNQSPGQKPMSLDELAKVDVGKLSDKEYEAHLRRLDEALGG